ncbi:MAG: hypothetical protein EBS42_06955, partial [Caulobacteraceae bacterium]|nr:hypothetical protein [Caulobacteraceae bacterium]
MASMLAWDSGRAVGTERLDERQRLAAHVRQAIGKAGCRHRTLGRRTTRADHSSDERDQIAGQRRDRRQMPLLDPPVFGPRRQRSTPGGEGPDGVHVE